MSQAKVSGRWAVRVGLVALCVGVGALSKAPLTAIAQQSLPVRLNRWLALEQATGSVQFQQGNDLRAATLGDRLDNVGEGLRTGAASSATLAVDTGIGFIDVAEQTQLRIQSLEFAPDNGRVTRLYVSQGQARLRVRPFTHRGSVLEIQTPAGVSGVRGTDFGLNVHPDGRMAVATFEGGVDTSAAGRTVAVVAGYQNLTFPGEAPLPAEPLRDDPSLIYRVERQIDRGRFRLWLIGQVDPVNLVVVDGVTQPTDRTGQFILPLVAQNYIRTEVTVITPLGTEAVYPLSISP